MVAIFTPKKYLFWLDFLINDEIQKEIEQAAVVASHPIAYVEAHAANLTEMLSLRAYDSVHLAAADLLAKQSKQLVKFACFDHHLNKAANILGLLLVEEMSIL